MDPRVLQGIIPKAAKKCPPQVPRFLGVGPFVVLACPAKGVEETLGRSGRQYQHTLPGLL
jgi:hypothetical protein